MHYNIRSSEQFDFDLSAAYEYILGELRSTTAAKNLKRRYLKALANLEILPEAFPRLNIKSSDTFRFVNCGNFIIVYMVKDEHVYLNRFLYAKSDIKNRLKDK